MEAVSALPIFEVAADGSGIPKSGSPEPRGFVDLGNSKLHLVPDEAPKEGTFTKTCLVPVTDTELGVLLNIFGVASWSLAEFYRQGFPWIFLTL